MNAFLIFSAVSGFLAVALGAFGAHALKEILDEGMLKIFNTGVQYQFYHTLALALVVSLFLRVPHPALRISAWAFAIGIIIFSGSLYLLVMTKVKLWGAVTPIGGVSFLVGWGALIWAALKMDFNQISH